MEGSVLALQNHEVNKVRIDLGENPATMIWLWGPGTRGNLPSFKERFGVEGAVISAIDLVKGIGKLVGFEVIKVPGATGYYNTNYLGKAEYALEALKQKDLVLVHLEGTDEAGHRGNLREKMGAIEKFDKLIVGTIAKGLRRNKNARILILPDHATLLSTRDHVNDPVPFLMWGKDLPAGRVKAYSEKDAKESGFLVEEGHRLMDIFIGTFSKPSPSGTG
jgi:2,3-bisphosphoglycerate-independent phosphoglycerate mutase